MNGLLSNEQKTYLIPFNLFYWFIKEIPFWWLNQDENQTCIDNRMKWWNFFFNLYIRYTDGGRISGERFWEKGFFV